MGNDVNKPLLEQLADDSGGLAAFLSPEDNVARQAKAFRRKLTRPVATDLKIDFGDVQVVETEPKVLPISIMAHQSGHQLADILHTLGASHWSTTCAPWGQPLVENLAAHPLADNSDSPGRN